MKTVGGWTWKNQTFSVEKPRFVFPETIPANPVEAAAATAFSKSVRNPVPDLVGCKTGCFLLRPGERREELCEKQEQLMIPQEACRREQS